MSRYTYAISALLALAGIAVAVDGVYLGESKPIAIGFILIFGAYVFALLYIGMPRKPTPPLRPADRPPEG